MMQQKWLEYLKKVWMIIYYKLGMEENSDSILMSTKMKRLEY